MGIGPASNNNNNWDSVFESWMTVQNIQALKESCPVQAIAHGIMGFAFGGVLGLFLSSIGPSNVNPSGSSFTKETLKDIFKEMGSRTWSSAKNLGLVATLFSSTECVIEGYRAKHDIYNTISAGCISGAVLGAKGGPNSAILGCTGFAAFSTAIEYFLQR